MLKDKISIEKACATLCYAYITNQIEFETLELFLHMTKMTFNGDDCYEQFKDTVWKRYTYLFK